MGVFLMIMIVKNVWGHLGIELFPKGFVTHPLTSWLTSTTHHDLHHQYGKGNYGFYFTWWDAWLGTSHPDYIDTFNHVTSGTK